MELATSPAFTNGDLRRARLLCENPLDQENLLSRIPPEARLSRLENVYAISAKLKRVRCAACGRALHHNGFTAILSDGSRALLGSTCGARIFGSWEIAKRELDGLRDRQRYLRSIDRLALSADAIWNEFENWMMAAKAFDAVMTAFETLMPDLFLTLRAEARRDGQLTSLKRVQVREMRQNGTIKFSSREEVVHYGPIPGRAAFLISNASRAVAVARVEIARFIAAGAHDDEISSASGLVRSSKSAGEALRSMEETFDAFRGIARFFEPQGLGTVARWAKVAPRLPGSYQPIANGLSRDDEIAVQLPAGYAPPTEHLLNLLRAE